MPLSGGLDYKAKPSILPAAARTDGTVTGEYVDTLGYEEVMIVVSTGTVTDGTHTFSLTECATSGGSYTAVAAADITCSNTGSGANGVILTTAAAHDNTGVIFFYKGSLRYIKVVCVSATCSTGAVFCATVVMAKPRHAPVAFV